MIIFAFVEPDIMWTERTRLLLGDDAMETLAQSHVLVVGLGGVGAICAEMLCRAGIGTLTIVDGDLLHETNRNRQLLALTSTDGLPKAEVMAERLRLINPDIRLHVVQEYLRDERLQEIIRQPYDYVVDAIDTVSPKVFLLYEGLKANQSIVSSMGAGGRTDPLQICIDDISATEHCRLAAVVRKRLRRMGVTSGIRAVFSKELVDRQSVITTEDEPNKKSNAGTISYMPNMFGCCCASVVIRSLTQKNHA